MQKKLLFFITLFFLLNTTNLLSVELIPLKKPIQTNKQKSQKLLIDVLKPIPKPIEKKVIEKKEKKLEEKIKSTDKKYAGIILPKKKPLIAGSKKKKIQ